MKSFKDLLKDSMFAQLPLGKSFSAKFKKFIPTKSGNGVMCLLTMVETTTGKAYSGSIYLAEKDAVNAEFDKEETVLCHTKDELNAQGFPQVVID